MINNSQYNNDTELQGQQANSNSQEYNENYKPFQTESSIHSRHVEITNKNIINYLECKRDYKKIDLPSIINRDLQDYRSEEDDKQLKSISSTTFNSEKQDEFKEVKE